MWLRPRGDGPADFAYTAKREENKTLEYFRFRSFTTNAVAMECVRLRGFGCPFRQAVWIGLASFLETTKDILRWFEFYN